MTAKGNNLYSIDVPEELADGNIIFYSDDDHRYPADRVPGLPIENRLQFDLSCTGGYQGTSYTINVIKGGSVINSASSITASQYSYTPEGGGSYLIECIVTDSHNQVSKKTFNVSVDAPNYLPLENNSYLLTWQLNNRQ